jgi:hypothetical protein
MSDDESKERARIIEREARQGRELTMADAVGREGAGWFKGESPVPMLAQATAGLCTFIDRHVRDTGGALRAVLKRRVKTGETIVGEHFDDPLVALELIVAQVLGKEAWFYAFVLEVDAEWGRIMLERPHFQRPGEEPDPEDEHTHESVRAALEALLRRLRRRGRRRPT